jgi:hypothetical protein
VVRRNQEGLAHLPELTLLHFWGRRNGVEVGAMRSREAQEVVFNPGSDFVHESYPIDKGNEVKRVMMLSRDRGPLGTGTVDGVELRDASHTARDLRHADM